MDGERYRYFNQLQASIYHVHENLVQHPSNNISIIPGMDSPVWSEHKSDTQPPTSPQSSASPPRLAASADNIRRNSVDIRRISVEDNSVRRTSRDYRRNSDDFIRRISIEENENRSSIRNSIESTRRNSDERIRRTPIIQHNPWTSPPTSSFGYNNTRAGIGFGLLQVASDILKV